MKFGIAAKLSILLAAVVVLAAGLTGYSAYEVSRDLLVQSAKNDLLTSTKVLARRVMLMREEISRNLEVLSSHPATISALQGDDSAASDQLAELFRLIMVANPAYFQMRLISRRDNGMERVRVDRDGARLLRVTDDDLQEKGHFQYVSDTLRLTRGETYLSRFAINHERGAHSGLEQPTAQLAMPVADQQGRVLGVVVINVDLNGTFTQLAADLPKEFQLFMANSRGDFLIHPDPTQAFGFDRGRQVLVQDEFAATRDLVDGNTDQVLIETSDGRYEKRPVVAAFIARPVRVSSEERQVVVGLAQPLASVLKQADTLGTLTLRIVVSLCVACILLAVLLARAVTRPINAMSAAVQRFADERQDDGLPLERKDEIGVLARSFHRMRKQIKQQLSDLHQSRQELEHLARHDILTGLPNRILFVEHIEHALASARRDDTRLALMFIDIDKFKPINDNLGHAIGDLLLKEIAVRLRGSIRESDTAARVGGDEFIVLLHTIQCSDDALTVAEKIRQSINNPFILEGHTVAVSACIGIALFPDDGSEIVELSQHADEAMYWAKEQGRNAVAFYNRTL